MNGILKRLAPRPQLLALAFALGLVSSGWADATLSYSGFVPSGEANKAAVFSGVTLSDINSGKYKLLGKLGGGNVNDKGGQAGAYAYSLSSGTLTVIFQRVDDGHCKAVEVKFTEDSGTIYAYANRAGYLTGGSPGLTADQINWWGTVVTSNDASGYGIYDICLSKPGGTSTVTNQAAGTGNGVGNIAATDTYTLQLVADSPFTSGGYVRLNSFAFGMNSSGDTLAAQYVTCADYKGSTVTSARVNGTGSVQTSTKFSNNSLKQSYSFGSVGSASECIVKVGTSYAFGLQDGNGTNVLQRVYCRATTDRTYSPVAQSTSMVDGYRMTQELSATVLASLETSTGGTWSALPFVDAPATAWSDSSYAPVILVVTDDCTITLDSAVSVESIIFDVAAGKTLTLSGNYTITAANGIYVRGGTVATSYGATFSGTLKGNGTVAYTTNAPSGVILTDAAWTGTVWLRGVAVTNFKTDTYANSTSGAKVKVSGVTGWISTADISNAELILEDDTYGFAFKINNANSINSSDQCSKWKKISGTGLLTTADNNYQTPCVKIYDASSFTGSINANAGNVKLIAVFCAENETFSPSIYSRLGTSNGKILVSAGSSVVSVAAGKTWSAPGGIFVDGSLIVNAGATIPAIGSGSAGVITAVGGATINGTIGSEISASLTFASANLSVVDTTVNTLAIPADTTLKAETFKPYMGTEKLDLTGCTSLTTLKLNLGASTTFDMSKVLLPASCTKVLIEVGGLRDLSSYTALSNVPEGVDYGYATSESVEEYANGTFSVANVPSGAVVSVARAGGTTSNATVTEGTARFADFGIIKISGAATDIDWTLTDGSTELDYPASGIGWNADSKPLTFYTDAVDSSYTGVYLKHHPWITGAAGFIHDNSAATTVAIVGTMPSGSKAIFMNFGSAYAGKYGLLLATTETENEVLVAYNYGATVTPITTMTVPNSATARHSYIITKEDGESSTTFTVYLDGIKWKTVTTNIRIEFSNSDTGLQLGSDFGGNIREAGYNAVSGNTGILNVLRVYGRIITPAEIAAYASTYPYVSPNGSSFRTFASAAESWIDSTPGSEVWDNSNGGKSGSPTAGAAVTVVADADVTVTVNLESETQYEALTINGASLKFANGANAGTVKVTGMTVVGATVTNVYGAVDMTGGPMTITEDGDITFDMTGYDASGIYAVTDVPITGEVDQNDAKVNIINPANAYRTYSCVYDSGNKRYVMRVTPERTTPSTVYYTGGAWTASVDFPVATTDGGVASTIVFPGDTLVIPSSQAGDSADIGATLPACVASISFQKDYTLNLTSTDAGDEITLDVPSGVTLTLNGTLTAGIINLTGGGTVVCSAGNTLNGTIKGSVTVEYPEHVLPTGAVWTDMAWAGTNVLTNCGRQNNDAKYTEVHGIVRFAQYGNVNSFIRAPGYNGISAAADQNTTCEATLIVDTTFELNHGTDPNATEFDSHGAGYRFKKLVGTGTLRLDGTTDTAQYIFDNVEDFAGAVEITFPAEGGRKSFLFGAEDYTEILSGAYAANLVIVDDVEVAAGKTWDVPAGIIINPDKTLTLGAGSTVKALSPDSTGTVSVPTGSATLQGVTNGTFNAHIEIGAGATLKVVDPSLKTLTIPADSTGGTYSNSGVLDLCDCTALETLHLVLGNSKATDYGTDKLLLPSTCTTIYYDIGSVRNLSGYTLPTAEGVTFAYYARETAEEYANGGFVVSNVADNATVLLMRRSGALITTDVSETDRTYSGGGSFAGAACWHEWDFEQENSENKLEDTGKCTTSGSGVSQVNLSTIGDSFSYGSVTIVRTSGQQETKVTIPSSAHPYAASSMEFGGNWSAAVRCTMPNANDNIAIAFGSKETGILGLASGSQTGFVELFSWTNNVRTTLAQLKVEAATTAMHIYVIAVTNDTSVAPAKNYVTLYRDGEFIHTAEFALADGASITNFMVGAVRDRTDTSNLPADASSGDVDYVRLYNWVIPESDVEGLSLRRPFVSSIDTYTREVDSIADWSEENEWTKTDASTGATSQVAAPADNGNVILTANSITVITQNLTDDAKYGTLIFTGTGSVGLRKDSATTGKIGAEMLVVRSGIELTVGYDAVSLTNAVVGVDPDASLAIDLTDFPFASVTANTNITLIGSVPAKQYDSTCAERYSIVVPALPAHIASAEAEWDGVVYKVAIRTDHEAGSDVYYKGGYWSSTESSFAVTNSNGDATAVLPGDTVVIPEYISGDNASRAFFDSALPNNVSAIRVEKDYTFESGVNNAAILGGVTVTVAEGKTLSFGAQYHDLTLGATTLNGAVNFGADASAVSISGNAAITVAEGKTLTLASNEPSFSGSIAGAGTVKIETANTTNGFNFKPYNTVGTLAFGGFSGWIAKTSGEYEAAAANVATPLRLDGNMTITALSPWTYTFSKLTGVGNLTIPSGDAEHTPNSFTIQNIEGYTGSLNNNNSVDVTVSRITLPEAVDGGTLLLATNGTGAVTVLAVYVGDAETATGWALAYTEGGVYRAAATYNETNYRTVEAAITAAGENYAQITVHDANAEIPVGYYYNSGHVGKCPAALVYDSEGTTNYYSIVQAAVDAANAKTRIAQTYDYVVVLEDAAVTTTETLVLKTTATVNVSKDASVSGEFALGEPSTVGDVTTYPINTVATVYTWDGSATPSDWEELVAWRYTVMVEEAPTPTQATRVPAAGDGVNFNADAQILVSRNEAAAAITNSAEIAFMKSGAADAVTVSAGEIVLTDVNASITVTDVSLAGTLKTTVESSYVKFADSKYTVDAYNVVTVDSPNATLNRTDALSDAIKDGDTITFTLTPSEGHAVISVTANGVVLSDPVGDVYSAQINEDTTIVVATSQGSTITNVSFDYYASYTNAYVTASVTASGAYTLTVGGREYTTTDVDGIIVFSNVDVSGVELGEGVPYTIAASGTATGSASGTSNVKGNAAASTDWMKWSTDAGTNVGAWDPTSPSYSEGVAAFTGTNTYSAAWVSTGEVVTVTTTVSFGDEADEELVIDADAQAAIRIGAGNVFQVYAGPTPAWVNVYNDELGAPDVEAEYSVAVKLNYMTQTFGVDVAKDASVYTLTNVTGGASFPLAKASSAMQKVSYLGGGSFMSLAGSYISAGYIANINAGTEITVATNVVVSQEFVSKYMGTVLANNVSDELVKSRSVGNGLSYLDCYALGLNPDKATDKPIVDVTTDASGNFVFSVKHPVYDSEGAVTGYEELTPADNVSLSVTFKYGTSEDANVGTSDDASLTPAEMFSQGGMSGNVIYYKAQINATAK